MRTIHACSLTIVVVLGCDHKRPSAQPPQAVQTHRLESRGRREGAGLRFSAVVVPDAQVALSFRVSGYVASLAQVRGPNGKLRDIAEGDRVKRRSELVRIRQAEYQDKVSQAASQAAAAEAAALKAQLDFQRANRLYESRSLTKPDFDAARAQYDATQAQLRAARAQTSEAQIALRDTLLLAPFDGDVVTKAVELGAIVGPGTPAFVLARTDVVKLVIGVPDTAVRLVKLGQPVEVMVDAFPDRTFQAQVSRIASAADQTTRNFDVEVEIPNQDHLLKVGMLGSLQLISGDVAQKSSAILVPLASIVEAASGECGVYVIERAGAEQVARLRPVEIGTVNGNEIHVVGRLSAGQEVITTGANLLKNGQRVEVVR